MVIWRPERDGADAVPSRGCKVSMTTNAFGYRSVVRHGLRARDHSRALWGAQNSVWRVSHLSFGCTRACNKVDQVSLRNRSIQR